RHQHLDAPPPGAAGCLRPARCDARASRARARRAPACTSCRRRAPPPPAETNSDIAPRSAPPPLTPPADREATENRSEAPTSSDTVADLSCSLPRALDSAARAL